MKKAPKAPEPEPSGEPLNLKGERVCITGTLPGMTRSEAFTRLKLAGGVPCERFTGKVTLFVVAADAGRSKREKAEKAIANGRELRIVNGTEFVKALNEQGKTAGERKQEEHMAKKREGVNREGLAELLFGLAKDRAAKDPHNRLAEGNVSQGGDAYVWRLQKDGRLTKDEYGNLTSWYLDGEFVTCIERRYAKRKVELYYPEITPFAHKSDLVKSRKAEDAKPVEAKAEDKEDTQMRERIEELEAKLKAMSAELEQVWKENAALKAAKKPQDAPSAPPKAPAAPKPKEQPATVESADKVAEISLESMRAWCKAKGMGLRAEQKNSTSSVWVCGVPKDAEELKAELKELGFHPGKSKPFGRGYWAKPTAA